MNGYIRISNNESFQLQEQYSNEYENSFSLYQSYKYVITIEFDQSNISKLLVDISGVTFELNPIEVAENKTVFRLNEDNYFKCIWGYTCISLTAVFESKEEKIFFTKLIKVNLNYKDETAAQMEQSLSKMIEYIINHDYYLLQKPVWERYSIMNTNYAKREFRTLLTEINFLHNIVASYNKNLPYFMQDLKYKSAIVAEVDNFEKVKTINKNTIDFIISNPQELYPVNSNSGIYLRGHYYHPHKTLVDSQKKDYNIYENKVILGFLMFIINYLKNNKFKFNEYLSKNDIENPIKKVVYAYYRFYFTQISLLLPQFEKLYYTYKYTLQCEEMELKQVPMVTNIFISFQHYRQIYIIIKRWFESGNYQFQNKDVLSTLISADQIYEYYCLLNIMESIYSLDFVLTNKTNFQYENCIYYPYDNTFIYSNGNNCKITLYYQPIIYSYQCVNNITLYRTIDKRKYYTPDFIIKIENKNGINYMVLDAKWQNRNVIDKYTYRDAIVKYVFSLDDIEGNEYEGLYLLQGQTKTDKIFNHHNSELSSLNKNGKRKTNAYIVPLAPENNNMDFITKILSKNIL